MRVFPIDPKSPSFRVLASALDDGRPDLAKSCYALPIACVGFGSRLVRPVVDRRRCMPGKVEVERVRYLNERQSQAHRDQVEAGRDGVQNESISAPLPDSVRTAFENGPGTISQHVGRMLQGLISCQATQHAYTSGVLTGRIRARLIRDCITAGSLEDRNAIRKSDEDNLVAALP